VVVWEKSFLTVKFFNVFFIVTFAEKSISGDGFAFG